MATQMESRKILLFLDKCAAHPKVVFLPPNTTSHLQPLDVGIIRNVKFHFLSLLVRWLLAKIEQKGANLKIDLDAIHFLAMPWDRVKSKVITNCFKKCGFFGACDDAQSVEEYDGNYCVLEISDCDHLNMDKLRTVQEVITDAISGTAEDDDDKDTQGLGNCCDRRALTVGDTFEPLDTLRAFVANVEQSDQTTALLVFFYFQKNLFRDIEKKKVPCKATNYFKVA